MSSFQFKTLQRVTLPASVAGAPNVQGVVIGGGTELDGIPSYAVQYLDHLKRSAKGELVSVIVTVGEPALHDAQPPKAVTEGEAERMVREAVRQRESAIFAGIEHERIQRKIARDEAARKRKKPAKAKSKSKRKR